jgi:hypothetical protein
MSHFNSALRHRRYSRYFRYSKPNDVILVIPMRVIQCHSCRELKRYFAKGMCSTCYRREQKRVQRGSKLADTSVFDMEQCHYRDCKLPATSKFGIPMCAEHHDECYHGESAPFVDFKCPCMASYRA